MRSLVLLCLLLCPGCSLGTITVTRHWSLGDHGPQLKVTRAWSRNRQTVPQLIRSYLP